MLISKVSLKNFEDELIKNENPFMDQKNLNLICSYLGCKLVQISLINKIKIDWIGYFFVKVSETSSHLFSGGRFGFAGFIKVNGTFPVISYLDKIEKSLEFLKLSSISLSISYLNDEIIDEVQKDWVFSKQTYFVAETSESIHNQKLIFKKSKVNSINKMLKKSYQDNLKVRFASSEKDVKNWYNNCHLVRIAELHGKKWDLSLIMELFINGLGELLLAENDEGELLGGCFVLISKKTLELFMISTPEKNLYLGNNYLIANELYLYAERNQIGFINWQASNPPNGSVSFFKERWNCNKKTLSILNKKFTNHIYSDHLAKNFPDCYVFPYDKILSSRKSV